MTPMVEDEVVEPAEVEIPEPEIGEDGVADWSEDPHSEPELEADVEIEDAEFDLETELDDIEEGHEDIQNVGSAMLRPVVGSLTPSSDPVEVQTASLRPLPPTLQPALEGNDSVDQGEESQGVQMRPVKGTLQPQKLTPVKKLAPLPWDEDEEQKSE